LKAIKEHILSGRYLYLICILSVLSPYATAGHPSYRLYTTEDGLPSTFVKHIQQIPGGYMAISTDDGIAFFDGYDFHYRGVTHGLPDQFVKQVMIDSRDRMLVATDRGVAIADIPANRIPETFTRIPFEPRDDDFRIRELYETRDGRILAAGQSLLYQLTPDNRLQEIPADFNMPRQNNLVRSFSFEEDEAGGVLITSAENNLLYLPPGGRSIIQIPGTALPDELRSITYAGNSQFWLGSANGLYLITWNPRQRRVTDAQWLLPARNSTIANITIDHNGLAIVGTDGEGIFVIDPESQQATRRFSFFSNYIKHVFHDEQKNTWISTDHGIAFIPNMPFGNFGPDDGLPRRYVTGITRDENDHLWVATHEGFFFKETGSATLRKTSYLDQRMIHGIYHCRRTQYLYAFTGHQIHSIDTRTQQGQLVRNLGLNTAITSGLLVGDRYFWLVSNRGELFRYDRRQDRLTNMDTSHGVTEAISGITRTDDGLIWISGTSGFLAWFHPEIEKFNSIDWKKFGSGNPGNAHLSYLHPGKGHYLWIGASDGIYSFDPFAEIPSLKKVVPLQNESVSWIRANDDKVWVGSNRHLYRFNKKVDSGENVASTRRFSTSSGLTSTNFSKGAAYLDDHGYLWMGTNVGASYYNNRPVPVHASPVKLRYWRVNDDTYRDAEIRRLPSDVTSMTFAFTTFDFPPEDVVFQSRMGGSEASWSEPTTNPVFTRFTGGSGRYTFEVRASRNSTEWTEPLAISFIIDRPWWQSNLMLAVYFLLLAITVFGLVQWNSVRLRIRNKKLADSIREHTRHLKQMVKKLEDEIKQREEIETELREINFTNERMIRIVSHDLRSPFQGILGFASMLQEEYNDLDEEERREMVAQIINSSNLAVSLLNQLLDWISLQTGRMPFSPMPLNLAENVKDISDLLKSLADSKDIRIESRIPENITVFADRNMLQSILRNLVGNAIKFTDRDGKVTLEATQRNSHTEISITDNGVGMDQETLEKILAKEKTVTTKGTGKEMGSGLGLVMTREMINRHGGELTGKSKIKRGTTFTFSLPNDSAQPV
jgi:signal transduction histidine kinase/ligand-binding sensor domain-containing protein